MTVLKYLTLLTCFFGLVGCTLPPEPGPYPTTGAQCKAQYSAGLARARGSAASSYNGTKGSLIGSALGRGIVKGMLENRYKDCLSRVGVDPSAAQSVAATSDTAAQQGSTRVVRRPKGSPGLSSPGCPPNFRGMYRGESYCYVN